MNVETSTTQTPRPDVVDGRRREPAEPGVEPAQPFAALLTLVHRGYGQQVSAMTQGLHPEAELPGSEKVDAHGRRLVEMSDRADAQAVEGRGSRLAAGDAAGDSVMGPRGHRLALQAEQQAQEASRTAGEKSIEGDGQDRVELTERVKAGAQDQSHVRGKSNGGEARLASRSEAVELKVQSDAAGSKGDGSQQPTVRANPVVQSELGPEEARIDRMVMPAERGRVSSVSKAADSPSVGRGVTAEGPRAVAGAEKSGQGRNSGEMTDQAAGQRFRARAAGGRGVAEGDTASQKPRLSRSEFERLVRTIRMQVGPKQSTARLHLRPPELGRIRIDTRMTGNRLEVLVQTQTADARELLQSRMTDLQAALERLGVRMERFELTATAQEWEGNSSDGRADDGRSDSQQSGLADDSGSGNRQARSGFGMRSDLPSEGNEEGVQEVTYSAAAETRLDLRA